MRILLIILCIISIPKKINELDNVNMKTTQELFKIIQNKPKDLLKLEIIISKKNKMPSEIDFPLGNLIINTKY
jgi:hypothetical protein